MKELHYVIRSKAIESFVGNQKQFEDYPLFNRIPVEDDKSTRKIVSRVTHLSFSVKGLQRAGLGGAGRPV